ncbi:hypothetical protein IAI58_11570 [Roseomonas marmotae]|uniref:DUF6527 family protein n=1 Tax=Roseomonas marmotae TaxID=2768161 RepID=UPI001AD71EA1|nr:DUF6527 family protein [Roseomonas marmotae]QTI78330.1 hypothetical protein IAI58_11570 [Roseomonas marmotae]
MSHPARTLRLLGEAEYRDEAEARLGAAGDAVLVVRGRQRSLVIACPDGCGETLVVNLDRRAGKAWRIDMRGEGATLIPSVWREGGCGSHFIVWRGRIVWCERFTQGNIEPGYDPSLEPRVLAAMDPAEPRTAETIAATIDELIWDVNRAARRLADQGLVETWKSAAGWLFICKEP